MRNVIVILALSVALAIPALAGADVFTFVDNNGVVVFTDNPQLVPSNMRAPRIQRASYTPSDRSDDFTDIIYKNARRYGLDPKFVEALIRAESNFDEFAVSQDGAMGLMQLMPETQKRLGVRDPFDPEQNIEGGTRFLRYLVERFKGDLELAVAAYNAGPLKVEAYGNIPPFDETQLYVKRIFSYYRGPRILRITPAERNTIERVVLKDGRVVYTNRRGSASD